MLSAASNDVHRRDFHLGKPQPNGFPLPMAASYKEHTTRDTPVAHVSAVQPSGPRHIFRNGRILVTDEANAKLSRFVDGCLVVADGVVQYAGPETPALRESYSGCVVRDLGGKKVLPGFIDGHMHLLYLGLALQKLNLEDCSDLDDVLRTVRAYAADNPHLPRILCRGWLPPMTDGRADAAALDAALPGDDRPVYIDAKDLHSAWCNGAALRELGVDALPRDYPQGGVIRRDAAGRATGLLGEAAVFELVWPFFARLHTLEERAAAMRVAVDAYAAAGYTGVCDMAMDEAAWAALQLLRARGELPLRVVAYWLVRPSASAAENLAQVDRAVELNRLYNATTSPMCRVAGVKLICDGTVDWCTATLAEPYASGGGTAAPIWTYDQLAPVVARADAAGLQCALHAIGDAAVRTAIDALERHGGASSAAGGVEEAPAAGAPLDPRRPRRHRIEHLELTSPRDAARLADLRITASVQPVHADPRALVEWPRLLGARRCGRAFAYADFFARGAVLALGTDAPTAALDPLPNLYLATTRRSPPVPRRMRGPKGAVGLCCGGGGGGGEAEREGSLPPVNEHFALSVAAALNAATRGSAYACYLDGVAGSLERGLSADFVVLDDGEDADGDDEGEGAPRRLLEASVREVWFCGRRRFVRDGADD
jgi:hypothetical protein